MPTLFAVCTPGLEPYLARELHQLGYRLTKNAIADEGKPSEDSGGVEFEGDISDIYKTNLHLRTASRVLLRLGTFRTTAFADLRQKASLLSWNIFFSKRQRISLRVTCHKSRLYHSDAVAERVESAISDALGFQLTAEKFDDHADNPPQLIIVRLVNDLCTVSLDTSGALLHRRGYRLAAVKAPLRENLAAGIIMASGWDRSQPLVDPFCGSGTIPIEAALLAASIAPGKNRRFAFMDWKNYAPTVWVNLRNIAIKEENLSAIPSMVCSDRDEGAIVMARENAGRAGVGEKLEFSCLPISAVRPFGRIGWLVTNPPYGIRIHSNQDLRNLYAQFGNILRLYFLGWTVSILCNDDHLLGQVKIPFSQHLGLINGGVRVKLSTGIVPNPSM